MKNKVYAISLLLSFLVVISHEMIFHHHHDTVADGLFCIQSDDSPGEKSEERNSDAEHNHPFPLHHHISATIDFVYARTNLHESNPSNKITTLFLVVIVFHNDFFELPVLTNNSYRNNPFLISSLFNPEVNALRGPPSIV